MQLYIFGVVAAVVLACVIAVARGTQRAGPGEKRTLAAIALGYVWAVVTMTIFVPAGAVFAFLLSEDSVPGAIGILAVVVSGIVHSIALVRAGRRLRRSEAAGNESVRQIAAHGAIHHAAVFAVFTAHALSMSYEGDGLPLIAALGVPCTLGAAIAAVLHGATTLAPAPSA